MGTKKTKRTKRGGDMNPYSYGTRVNKTSYPDDSVLYEDREHGNVMEGENSPIGNQISYYNSNCSGMFKTKSPQCKEMQNNIDNYANNITRENAQEAQDIYTKNCPKTSFGTKNTSSVCQKLATKFSQLPTANSLLPDKYGDETTEPYSNYSRNSTLSDFTRSSSDSTDSFRSNPSYEDTETEKTPMINPYRAGKKTKAKRKTKTKTRKTRKTKTKR